MWDHKGPNSALAPERSTPAAQSTSDNDRLQIITLLGDLFPQAFFVYERRRLPLKVGIYEDLLSTGCFAGLEADLKTALRRYTGNQQYQRKLKAGATRIDLNGEAAGTVSEDQAQGAAKLIAWRARRLHRSSHRRHRSYHRTRRSGCPSPIYAPLRRPGRRQRARPHNEPRAPRQ